MNTTKTQLKLIRAVFICVLVFAYQSTLKSQTILFYEDFDVSNPVISLRNMGDPNLVHGPSPCGKASWGDTSDFNTPNVDFDAATNPSHFMGVNPQAPCGGFYTATVYSDTLNFSGMDSLQFSCTYLVTNTLGWGPTSLQVIFDNGTVTDTVSSQFTSLNFWDDLAITLPANMVAPAVSMRITLGGGSGVGLDNIVVSGFPSTAGLDNQSLDIDLSIYPNPASDFIQVKMANQWVEGMQIIDLQGKVIYSQMGNKSQNAVIPVQQLENGIYILAITNTKGEIFNKKIVISH